MRRLLPPLTGEFALAYFDFDQRGSDSYVCTSAHGPEQCNWATLCEVWTPVLHHNFRVGAIRFLLSSLKNARSGETRAGWPSWVIILTEYCAVGCTSSICAAWLSWVHVSVCTFPGRLPSRYRANEICASQARVRLYSSHSCVRMYSSRSLFVDADEVLMGHVITLRWLISAFFPHDGSSSSFIASSFIASSFIASSFIASMWRL